MKTQQLDKLICVVETLNKHLAGQHNQQSHGGGGGGYAQARTAEKKAIAGTAKKFGLKKVSGVFQDEDAVYYEGGKASDVSSIKKDLESKGYKKVSSEDAGFFKKAQGDKYRKTIKTSTGDMPVYANVDTYGDAASLAWYGKGAVEA